MGCALVLLIGCHMHWEIFGLAFLIGHCMRSAHKPLTGRHGQGECCCCVQMLSKLHRLDMLDLEENEH